MSSATWRLASPGGNVQRGIVSLEREHAESDETWTPIEMRDNAQVLIVDGSDK